MLVTLVAYLPAIRAGYIWDDDSYLTQNATLTHPDALWRIWFDLGATPQYYPLVFTTFWIEQRLWGLDPLGHHLVNVLLHATCAVLLWLVLRRLAVPGAYLAAAIFALHPVHVESVAWITERKNVLSGVFAVASALMYLRFCGLDRPGEAAGHSWWAGGASLVLFACALLGKTVVCGLPVVLLLLIWWRRGRLRWADGVPIIPMLLLGAALGLTTAWVERHVVAWRGVPWHLPPLERVLLAGRVMWFYAGKLVWPAPLMFSYPRWEVDGRVWWQYVYPAAAAAMLLTLWLLRSRIGRGPLVAVLAFAVLLFPALGFFNVYPMQFSYVADHFQYHASIAIIALIAASLTLAARRIEQTGESASADRSRRDGRKIGRTALACALLVALGVKTWRQTKLYKDGETLWHHTLQLNPRSWVAHLNLAKIHQLGKDFQGFADHLEQAVRLNPNDDRSYKALGDVMVSMNRYDEAVRWYEQALKHRPDDGQIHHNLANILVDKGRADEAIRHYREAIRFRPKDLLPHYSLGLILQQQGKASEASEEFRAALARADGSTDPAVVADLRQRLRLDGQGPPTVRDERHR